jgi:DNA-binding GntR family transcriptional regulator
LLQQASEKVRFAPVRNRALRHEVLELLRNAILFGQISVGERLLEVDLANQMGVSRVPVREALQKLEHEGLVVSSPHRGTIVIAVNDDEVEVLYHLRAELEGFVGCSLMERGAGNLVVPLQQLVDEMRAATKQGRVIELEEKDLEFHRLLVSQPGYPHLNRVWNSMDGPIRAHLYRSHHTGPFRQEVIDYTAESHQPIVDAIASGDSQQVVQAIKTHILETRRLIEKGPANRGSP